MISVFRVHQIVQILWKTLLLDPFPPFFLRCPVFWLFPQEGILCSDLCVNLFGARLLSNWLVVFFVFIIVFFAIVFLIVVIIAILVLFIAFFAYFFFFECFLLFSALLLLCELRF